jgi:hypothetical protein
MASPLLTLAGPRVVAPPLACSYTRGGPSLASAMRPRTRSTFDDGESERNADDGGTSPEIRFSERSSFKSCNNFLIFGGSSLENRILTTGGGGGR